jgi:enoyl-CoA hydratase/carnithine racemase
MYESILLDKANYVATITLNRPEKHNAMDAVSLREFSRCMNELANDDDTRAIIITGAGRFFCPGMDLGAVAQAVDDPMSIDMGRSTLLQPFGLAQVVPTCLRTCYKPTIAAVNGAAAGMGLALACLCDYRIASEQAIFTPGFINLGMAAELGLTYILPRLMPLPVALEFLSTGERKDARWAERFGLVREVVPPEGLMQAAQTLAAKLVKMPPIALQTLKQLIYQGLETNFDVQLRTEGHASSILTQTEDYKEGVLSFLEKRPPVFRGR